jgi:hypothetical protein
MINLTAYNTKELQELVNTINEEIAQRQKREYEEDYRRVLSILKNMTEKYPYEGSFYFGDYECTWEDIYDEIERRFEG